MLLQELEYIVAVKGPCPESIVFAQNSKNNKKMALGDQRPNHFSENWDWVRKIPGWFWSTTR